ncbi:uncharacterized protein [Rutidosis leptorrhynchoides]|uniref:uncharacterized protein isoform X2 n=1 Tax=Rutidosis leptorrhynchoides TaxID=125765 RepID=UPI003A9A3821
MAVDTDFKSLLNNKLKVEDPSWLTPRPWESIPTESGPTSTSSTNSTRFNHTSSSVSEASLVRLAMNALQGLESSLISIEKLCTIFRSDPTDRTFHRIPSMWNNSLSTLALDNILTSLGCMGTEVFLLLKFVDHFTNLNCDDATSRSSSSNMQAESQVKATTYPPYSLVNQAFAVAIKDILDGYIAALDTISSSVCFRRLSNNDKNMPSAASTLGIGGCFSTVGHSEITLLEVYLHTKQLRNQIEVIGSICNVHNVACCFTLSPLEDLDTRTKFGDFPRGGNLLTYLYTELKVADPAHCALLKTLFIRSCEPYFGFIRSWIFKAKITDPFNEFIVAEAKIEQPCSISNTGFLIDFPSATIREQDGAIVPCFLKDFLIPLFRAGQQLQVLIKLLEFSDGVGSWNRTYEDFLPYWSKMASCRLSHSNMSFSKEGIEMVVLERSDYYKIMMEKLESHLPNLEFKYHQVIAYSTLPTSADIGTSVSPSVNNVDQNLPLEEGDECSMTDELSYMDDPWDSSSDCSSINNSDEENASASEKIVDLVHDSKDLENKYLSALEISSDTPVNIMLKKSSHDEIPVTNGKLNGGWPFNPTAKNSTCNGIGNIDDTWSNASIYKHEYNLSSRVLEQTKFYPLDQISNDNEIDNETANLSLRNMNSWEVECSNQILGTSKLREKWTKVSFPSFDFKSVRDPFTECVDRLGNYDRVDQFSVSANNVVTKRNSDKKEQCGDVSTVEKNSLRTNVRLDTETYHREQAFLSNVSGGGCWESLLDRTYNKNDTRPGNHKTSVAADIEIPLDFVLEKCLLEEIQLQYTYVSKLTIKLLEEGFSLQEHLLALRRYHMMESADWADLFIMSLRHHKWYATEADKSISEIQGLLEFSVQRSSCERDRYKDRVFVYMKETGSSALPGFANGIQSFNALGLGYRVDWPVSIVLTPGALKIYTQIFSFLLQVKLALSSLTEVWCSFKEFIHFTNQNRCFGLRKSEFHHFNIMVKLSNMFSLSYHIYPGADFFSLSSIRLKI